MGSCCSSRSSTPYGTPPVQAAVRPIVHGHESSQAAINQPARSLESERDSGILPAPTTRPNIPIQPPEPLSKSPSHIPHQPPPWTRTQLEREREAFFDTRVSGNAEIWEALRVVAQEVRKHNLAEAQAILDALGVTCPNGRMCRAGTRDGNGRISVKGGLYDERGEMYDLPQWIVADPEDVVEDQADGGEGAEEKSTVAGAEATDGTVDDDDAAAAQRRDEKGKGKAEDPGERVQLRVRLSDRGSDIVVPVGAKQKIGDIVRLIREQHISSKRIRLIYLGKTLDERLRLEDTPWTAGHVLNGFVFEGDETILPKASK